MAYVAGDTITTTEYNTFVNSSSSPFGYNYFAGTGSGQYGLGQTAIATVTAGDTVTAAQFNSLFTALNNIANHTNDTLTSTSAVATGDTIAIRAALEADIATLAASVAAGSPNATALTTNALTTVTNSNTWNSTSTIEISVTFASADTMRYFFNAGGKIRCAPGISGTVDGSKDDVFSQLATGFGNIDIGALASTRSGSGETTTTNGLANGFHDLGTGYTTILLLNSDNGADYNSNTMALSAKLDAAVGTAVTMTVRLVCQDPAGDETYTAGNTAGVAANPNEAPRISLAVSEIHPNANEGLAAAIQVNSFATVSNSAS